MIVRILGEGQFRLDDAELQVLNRLDEEVEAAAQAGDPERLGIALAALLAEVREQGDEVPADELVDSDLILPDKDATLDEIRTWLEADDSFTGLLPE